MNGLQNIIAKIEEEARTECEKILEAADSEAKRISDEYALLTATAEAEIAEKLEREAEAVISRAKSKAAMTKRNIVSGARSSTVDLAYKTALDRIYALPREKYAALVMAFAVEAIKSHVSAAASKEAAYGEAVSADSFELVFNERDRAEIGEYCVFTLKNNYKKELGSDILRRVCLADDAAKIDGGVIVRSGSVEENCALSLLIEELRSSLDPIVYKTLYPEL